MLSLARRHAPSDEVRALRHPNEQRPAAGCSGPKGLPAWAVQLCGGHFERLWPADQACWDAGASIDPGDVGEFSLDAFELAGCGRLAGLQVDRIERAPGREPRGVVFALRHDVERHWTFDLHAEHADGVEHAVVRRRLAEQMAGGIDIVKRRSAGLGI